MHRDQSITGRGLARLHRRPDSADAILDRILHRSHRIHLAAKESMREREAAK